MSSNGDKRALLYEGKYQLKIPIMIRRIMSKILAIFFATFIVGTTATGAKLLKRTASFLLFRKDFSSQKYLSTARMNARLAELVFPPSSISSRSPRTISKSTYLLPCALFL